ncbi:tetratricopeptide repeat-containing sensor histidine kinase [Roseimarinus sediminis]|uniref:tetratricopeptide repeat-containing sensor histidine kinase n=1 Tax=Roseimarinus sediminis TaxID=1610899 RepID=UPI003D213B84
MKKFIKIIALFFLLKLFSFNGNAQNTQIVSLSDTLTMEEQVRVCSNLCWKNREKDSDLAMRYGKMGIELAEKEGLNSYLPKLYNYVGVVYQHYKHEPEAAVVYYDRALQHGLKNNDSVEVAYVYNNLGDAFYLTGNVPLAIEYGRKSLDLFAMTNNQTGIAYSCINMGLAYRLSQEYDSALYYFNEAIDVRKVLNDSIGIASATLELAHTHNDMGNWQLAMKYYRSSLQKHLQLNNKNYMAYSLNGIGQAYLKANKNDSALIVFRQALQLSEERNNITGMIGNQCGMAMAYAQLGKRELGEEALGKALENARISGFTRQEMYVYKTWADVERVLDNYKAASQLYQRYIGLYDSLYAQQQFQTMNELKNRFIMSEEINRINIDLAQRKKEKWFLLVVIVLLLLMAGALIMGYRTKTALNSRLKDSNDAKNQLLSIIAHDLVNPFNVLMGMNELQQLDFDQHDCGAARIKGLHMQQTTRETYKMIVNLLDWARAQSDRIQMVPEKFNLSRLMKDVKKAIESMASTKDISIECELSMQNEIVADPNMIRTVLMNLLSNAIKFTPTGGKIRLESFLNEKQIEVRVSDTGIGIPDVEAAKLFKENLLSSRQGTNNERGTGLGLLLCKDFIERHHGKIRVESREGKGSIFSFVLPLQNKGND